MDADAAQSIGVVLGVIVAASLALATAIGPLLMYLTEAVKATGLIRAGWSGIVSLFIGMMLGGALGGLTDSIATEGYPLGTMIAVGMFAGALMAASSVSSFKASGEVNPQPTPNEQTFDNDELETMASMRANSLASEPLTDTPLSEADILEMQAELDAHDAYQADAITPNVFNAPPLPTDEVATPADSRKA